MPFALSIASNVVHGYVGNRAMVFPLQYSGWDIDALHTTNYSNHPGYGKFKGQKSTPEEIANIFTGLGDIMNLNKDYDLIITGYTPTAEMLKIIYENIVSRVFQAGKGPVWVLDPVLGDNGKLYVLGDIVPVYLEILQSGYITLTTPNQFEFELLSGVKINDLNDIKDAFKAFHEKFPKVPFVVVSSVVVGDKMYSIGFNKGEIFYIEIEQINCSFNGCGDLFTALISNELYENKFELSPQVLNTALLKLNRVLKNTYEYEKLKQNGCHFSVVKDLRLISLREVFTSIETVNDLMINYISDGNECI